MRCWLTAALILLLPGCSPLSLVNGLSSASEAVAVVNHKYGRAPRQQLDVYLPDRVIDGSPVVVFFYGGGWKRGEKGKYGFVGHRLAGKGYITVIPDYRLYPQVTFPVFVEDGADALAWVRDNVAQARHGVVVMGHSAGAHTAALLALDRRYLEAAGQPASMIRGMIGLAGPYDFNPMAFRSTRPIFAGVEDIEKAMPATFACSAKTPLLLLHGAEDRIVIPDHSRTLKRRADACAGNATYVELDDIGHFSIVLGLSDSFLAEDAVQLTIDMFLQSFAQPSS